MRVAVFFHRFGPYHCARLEAAARCCDLTAIEVAGETEEYAWSRVSADAHGYKRMTLFPTGNTRAMPPKRVYHAVDLALANAAPEVAAIPGWSDNAALIALSWAATHGIPAILMSESTAHDQPRVSWREWVKRRVVDLYSSALVGGQRHVDYLVDLGMPRERIFTGYDVVDNEYFAQKTKEVRGQRSEVRKQYGLPINYFLASARFIPKKNLLALVRAYAEYRQRAKRRGQSAESWELVLLGDGPLKADLSRLISDLRLDDCVHLPGFKQYDELPVYYALANAFVHVSKSEQWGLVVNEALASGLPVIVSNRCGCVPE
ncbi:MAG TPA: glycosyltransferase, partial [Candidatus Udaeobacter sp.]|nr:glycosyltransferase [Candidatus Udaeobacter sp.]